MDVWTHAVGRMPYRFDRFPRTKEHCLNGVWDFALISRADAKAQSNLCARMLAAAGFR